jgi:phosphoglycolate phosphatase-like HAD superfamily hydrolase
VCDRYADLLETELRRPTARVQVMPGVPALLDRLEREPRVVLGLLTGNLARGAALKLRAGGIDPGRFVVGAYGSDSAHRPALPPIAASRAKRVLGRVPQGHEVVIIGDTPADVACGASLGARALAVATGGYTVEQLAACGPYAAFTDLTDGDAVMAAILD